MQFSRSLVVIGEGNTPTCKKPIGKGGHGRVWKVTHKKSKRCYAAKQMLKARVVLKRSVNSVFRELFLLKRLRHDFLINLNFAFQDKSHLYLILDYASEGDLRFHLTQQKSFNNSETLFIVGCIVLALEYVHSNQVIHRDLKPENLVFDDKGYLHLTDFGIAREHRANNAGDTSGSLGYTAPETLLRQNYSVEADFFALGVIVHECIFGVKPYNGANTREVRDLILAKQVQVPLEKLKGNWMELPGDFCNKLIQRKPEDRLGVNGIEEIKQHPWFAGFDWDALKQKSLPSPFLSEKYEGFKAVNKKWNDKELVKKIINSRHLFPKYFFDINSRVN